MFKVGGHVPGGESPPAIGTVTIWSVTQPSSRLSGEKKGSVASSLSSINRAGSESRRSSTQIATSPFDELHERDLPMFRIHVQPLPGESFDIFVEGGVNTLGRSSDCDVTLPSRYISREHAVLRLSEDVLEVEDLNSHNGTRLGDERIQHFAEFDAGVMIRIGKFHITVEVLPDMPPDSAVSSHISCASFQQLEHRPSEALACAWRDDPGEGHRYETDGSNFVIEGSRNFEARRPEERCAPDFHDRPRRHSGYPFTSPGIILTRAIEQRGALVGTDR